MLPYSWEQGKGCRLKPPTALLHCSSQLRQIKIQDWNREFYQTYNKEVIPSILKINWREHSQIHSIRLLLLWHQNQTSFTFIKKILSSCLLSAIGVVSSAYLFSLGQFSYSVMSNSMRPMHCNTPGFPVHHQLPELAQTYVHRIDDAIQPSHGMSSPSPVTLNLVQHQGLS